MAKNFYFAVGAEVSNIATVAITVTPVNDAPTAANDTATTPLNAPMGINVQANDTDPDGAADLVAAVIVTQPAAGAGVGAVGGLVNFNATTPGSYGFTYMAQGTVSPAVAETITLSFVNAAGTTLGAAGTATCDNTGKWEVSRVVALPTGATALKAVAARGGTRTIAISFK